MTDHAAAILAKCEEMLEQEYNGPPEEPGDPKGCSECGFAPVGQYHHHPRCERGRLFGFVRGLKALLVQSDDISLTEVREDWLKALAAVARELRVEDGK